MLVEHAGGHSTSCVDLERIGSTLGGRGDAYKRHGEERGQVIDVGRLGDLAYPSAVGERVTEGRREAVEVGVDMVAKVPSPAHEAIESKGVPVTLGEWICGNIKPDYRQPDPDTAVQVTARAHANGGLCRCAVVVVDQVPGARYAGVFAAADCLPRMRQRLACRSRQRAGGSTS